VFYGLSQTIEDGLSLAVEFTIFARVAKIIAPKFCRKGKILACRQNTFIPINDSSKAGLRVALCGHPFCLLAAFEVAQVPLLAGKPEKKPLSAVEAAIEAAAQADGPRKMRHK